MAITDIKLEPMNVSFNAVDCGATDGGVTVTLAEELVDITTDQTGTQIMDAIRSGNSAEVSLTLKEMTAAQWKRIVSDGMGAAFTPAAGTETAAVGSSKKFTAISTEAAELILKPVGSSDDLRNVTAWKAYPMPDSINYSGDSISMMSVTFKIIPDTTLDSQADLFVFGDGGQDFS